MAGMCDRIHRTVIGNMHGIKPTTINELFSLMVHEQSTKNKADERYECIAHFVLSQVALFVVIVVCAVAVVVVVGQRQ